MTRNRVNIGILPESRSQTTYVVKFSSYQVSASRISIGEHSFKHSSKQAIKQTYIQYGNIYIRDIHTRTNYLISKKNHIYTL